MKQQSFIYEKALSNHTEFIVKKRNLNKTYNEKCNF